jgi:chitinase
MKIHKNFCLHIFLTVCLLQGLTLHAQPKKVVIAYVFAIKKIVNPDSIDASKLTHVNYAFVNVRDGKAWLEQLGIDTINFERLRELKKVNSALKILISIGGWSWSKSFSDVSLTDSSRKIFSESAVAIVDQYQLDGVDIDWEYPGMRGDSNKFRPEDKQNYTSLFKELRFSLDSLSIKNKKRYELTTATGGFPEYLTHTEMNKVQDYLDYVNIMTYDFKTEDDKTTGHHTNLYSSKRYRQNISADEVVTKYINAGVPPGKIVLGVAFYGRAWKTEGLKKRGLDDSITGFSRGAGFTRLKDSVINRDGYARHWDRQSKAPYLYNKKQKIFISYDDEKSIRDKARYVNKKQLAGLMFWDYFSDPKEYLLKTIHKYLGKK